VNKKSWVAVVVDYSEKIELLSKTLIDVELIVFGGAFAVVSGRAALGLRLIVRMFVKEAFDEFESYAGLFAANLVY